MYLLIALNERVCFNCLYGIEVEKHVLLHYDLYKDIRDELLDKCIDLNSEFETLNKHKKLCFLMSGADIVNRIRLLIWLRNN